MLSSLSYSFTKAAGETSKYEPPNIAAFDGSRSTLSSGPKARGRAGPNSIASSAAIAPTSDNALAVVLANFLPALIGASRKRSHSPDPHTPIRKRPQQAPPSSPITSPALKFYEILHACMIDLATQHGGDFYASSQLSRNITILQISSPSSMMPFLLISHNSLQGRL